jgi:hypothetical protein
LTKVFLVFRALGDQLALPLVERVEVVAADVDLAAHLEHLGRCGLLAQAQAQGHLLEGADVLRHVLAGLAVAARGRLHQHPVLVAQVDRQAVELQLGCVLTGGSPSGQASSRRTRASKASAPLSSVSVSVRIDSIGTAWRTGTKPSSTLPSTPLRRRIGAEQLGMRRLDRLQLLEQRSYSASGSRARRARSSGGRGGCSSSRNAAARAAGDVGLMGWRTAAARC